MVESLISFFFSGAGIVTLIGIGLIAYIYIKASREDRLYTESATDDVKSVADAVRKAQRCSQEDHQIFVSVGNQINEDQWGVLTEYFHGEAASYGDTVAFRPRFSMGRLLAVSNPLKGVARKVNAASPARSSVGLCIILGVAGTFLGITIGLFGADLSDVAGTQQLINGMKTSFFTSLMGLLAAGALTRKFSKSKQARQQVLAEAQDKIDAAMLPMGAAHVLGDSDPKQAKKAADATLDAATQLSETAGALQSSVGELAQAANGLSADAIGRQVGESVRDAIDDQLKPTFEEISDELKILREIKADQGQETLELLIEQLRDEVLEPMGHQLQESAKLTSQSITSVDKLRDVVQDAVSHMRDDLNRIQQFQDDTLSQMRTFAEDLQDRVEHVMDESLTSVNAVADDVTGMVEDGKSAMEAQRTAFDESTEHAREAFSDVGERLGSALTAHTEEAERMFDRVVNNVESVQERFEEAFAQQNDMLINIGDEASQTMRQASIELATTTKHIRTVLGEMRQVTQEELEQFRTEYQDNLEAFFHEQNNLLEETLGEQRDALQEAVASLREAMHQSANEQRDLLNLMDERLDAMVDTVEEVNGTMTETIQHVEGFAERLGLTTGKRTEELQLMTDEIAKTVHILRSESQEIRKDLEKSHRISQENLQKYIEQTEASQQRFFDVADESISELGNKLLDISEGVDYAAETLVSAVEHQQNGRSGA